jgi:hypothetical protein
LDCFNLNRSPKKQQLPHEHTLYYHTPKSHLLLLCSSFLSQN